MKISLLVKTDIYVEIYGLNGTESLEFVHYNTASYDSFESLKRVYDNSETMKRYMDRMVKTYGRNIGNIRK